MMRGSGVVISGALLIVIGGGVLGFAVTRKTTSAELTSEQSAAMATAIATFDAELKGAHGKAHERATTISQNAFLINGLTTGDPETIADQVRRGETSYATQPGESIEIGRNTTTGLEVLSRKPEDAKPSGVGGKTASSAVLADKRLLVYEVVEVTADSKQTVGYVTVRQTLELERWFGQLEAAGIVGRFELGDHQVTLGGGLPADVITADKRLEEPGAKLVVATPNREIAEGSPALIGAGAGVAGLGLLLVVFGVISKRKPVPAIPAVEPSRASADAVSELAQAQTQLMTPHDVVASGTPSSIGGAARVSLRPSGIEANSVDGAGAMIGRWEVVRRLGSGGMADVFLARSKGEAGFEKLVAIKVMHPHLARNERSVALFLDVSRLAARSHHPNVVAIQDLGKIGDDYVIVMDYVEGVDLERLLVASREANRPIPIDVGLGIVCRICDGLNAAHTATGLEGDALGIVHRDVKSANVLISKQGGVKVVDFGIAKAVSQSHVTVDGETKGTPSMMAPEQRVGEAVDVRADVYSAAAVGFEILTGHAVNLDLAALAHLGIDAWPHLPLPSTLRPQLPSELDQVLLGAMAFERDKRPADCVAFEAQLAAVMKRHGFAATDKDIARWVEGELRELVPPFDISQRISRPVGVS